MRRCQHSPTRHKLHSSKKCKQAEGSHTCSTTINTCTSRLSSTYAINSMTSIPLQSDCVSWCWRLFSRSCRLWISFDLQIRGRLSLPAEVECLNMDLRIQPIFIAGQCLVHRYARSSAGESSPHWVDAMIELCRCESQDWNLLFSVWIWLQL